MPRKFSSARNAEDVNLLENIEPFELDDDSFAFLGEISSLEVSDLARRVMSGGDSPEAQASMVASMSETVMMALGEAEYQRFLAHVQKHHTPDRVIVEIMQAINDEIQAAAEKEAAGRPTGKSSPSSGGPPAMDERTSRIISLQTGDVTVLAPGDHKEPTARPNAKGKPRGRRATA